MIVELRPHWSALGRSLPVTVAVAVGAIALSVAWPSAPTALGQAVLVVVGLCALWLAARVVRWSTTSLVVTNARLLQRAGVLSRRGSDIRLERINEISYYQSIWQRVLGTGRLCVEVGGGFGVVCFDHVRKPAAVAGVLHEQIDAVDGPSTSAPRSSPPAPSGPSDVRQVGRVFHDTPPAGLGRPASLSDRLVELDELRRRGLLTEEEFVSQKARLLDERP